MRRPSPDHLRKLKDEAAEAAARGRLDTAADLYREAVEADPRDAGTRQRLAEVLRRAGRTPEAIEAYREVASRFAQDGLLVKAIAISKTILELEPRHLETQSALAELYAQRAVAVGARPPRQAMAPSVRAEPPTAFAQICSAAREAGADEDLLVEVDPLDGLEGDGPLGSGLPAAAPPPAGSASSSAAVPATGALPRVPIFSDLSREAFLALARAMVLHRVRAGDVVLREREEGTSFYVVASGKLAVSKRDETGDAVPVARLGEGDFFGEMALLSGAPRAATVTAEEDCEVLEFRADVLLQLARQHPHLARSLRRFYRQRLVANALAVSPIFRPFSREDRKLLMERFRSREVAAGEVVVREGEPSDGLYVVLEGAVDVVKRAAARQIVVGHLCEGDLFGEMSCLRKAPASASVVVKRPGTLLRLPRKDFDDLVVSHPQILELLSTLSEERAESLDAILSGRAQWTDEGLVLI